MNTLFFLLKLKGKGESQMEATMTKDAKEGSEKKETVMNKILGAISGSFAPILGVLAGSGLLSALLAVLTMLGWMSKEGGTYAILSAAGHAIFYFFPVFLGITLAIKLGANAYVGGTIGAALLEPHYTDLIANGVKNVDFIGIPVIVMSYSSTVFPILIAVSIYAILDKFLKKVIYKEIQMFINPLISLVVIVPLTLLSFWSVWYVCWGRSRNRYRIFKFKKWTYNRSCTRCCLVIPNDFGTSLGGYSD